MSSRIDVELTSKRDDDTWTWRVAGARQPKGILSSKLLYPGAKVGDVVKVDALFEIDGITVQQVLPPRTKEAPKGAIELKPTASSGPLVTSRLNRSPAKDRDRRRSRDRSKDTGTESESVRRRPQGRVDREFSEKTKDRTPKRTQSTVKQRPIPESAPKPRFKRLVPGSAHKNRFITSIPEEHRPIADQLLKGGIPAVRSAFREGNAEARSKGLPETPEDVMMKIAENLLPSSKLAIWLDRAEAALKDADQLSLRDLRSVVASADSVRSKDETARTYSDQLKLKLKERSEATSLAWTNEIEQALQQSRIVRALRLSARPPEPTAKFPQDLMNKLIEATNVAMAPETTEDRWIALIDAVSESPIRRQVVPAGFPEHASPALLELAKEHSGRIPSLARILGISVPPPPKVMGAMKSKQRDHSRANSSKRNKPATTPVVDNEPATTPVVDNEPATTPVVDNEPATTPVVDNKPATTPVVDNEGT